MKLWFVVGIILLILTMAVSWLYFANLNKMEYFYDLGYNNCIDGANSQRIVSVTKDNVNNPKVNNLKELYGEETINSCIDQDGCFSTCGNSCSYINPKDLSFIETLKYKSKNCLAVCEPQCFYTS